MEVTEAADGGAGVEMARAEPPDVILLDLMMPGMDGRQTLAALRADPATAAIPVIFLTANAHDLEALAALDVAGVLLKPFDPRGLSGEVRRILGRPPEA